MVESDALRLVFVAGMAAAGAWDLRTQRIPNALTLPLALSGLAAALWERGWPGAGWSVLGVLAPLLLLAFPLAAGWIGGGDVKLLMAAGAWLGPWGALGVSLLGSAFGGVAAVCYVLWCAGRDGWLAMAVGHPSGFVQHVRRHYGRRTLAYGPALAVAGVLWLYGGDRLVAALV